MGSEVYPVILEPVVLEKPWGRKGGASHLFPGIDPSLKIGEIWLTADNGKSSLVANGYLKGSTLSKLRSLWKDALTGSRYPELWRNPLPLLLKYIHAAEYLSVQVHPDDITAKNLEGRGPGKTESWYIMEADDESRLVMGLKKGFDPKAFQERLEANKLEDILNFTPVFPGEAYYIYPGRVHAIGPGITLFEIQQNADITYRFHDWGRVDKNGTPRELHIEKAFKSLDTTEVETGIFRGLEYKRNECRAVILAAGRYFALERLNIAHGYEDNPDGERFEILTTISGSGRLVSKSPEPDIKISTGSTIIIPAGLGKYAVEPDAPITMLRSWLPHLRKDIVDPLLTAGYEPEQIVRLAGEKRPNDLSGLLF